MLKIAILFFALLTTSMVQADEIYARTLKLMGCRFEITVVAENQEEADQYIQLAVNEISRIETLISEWDSSTQTSEVNRNAGLKPVPVDRELFELIARSIRISKITDGAFDISFAAMDKIWRFDGTMTQIPDSQAVKQSVAKVGYRNIELNPKEQTVFLKFPGMKIGFGAIGKGYAADMAKQLLMEKGVKAGMVNASGDLNCWGTKPDGSPWLVGITNPLNKNHVFSWFPLDNSAVVTSGNYEKFVTINGNRYAHIIDPRTGFPSSGITSVSVFASKAELADALATSVFVMGTETGLNFINQLPGVEVIIVDDKGSLHFSENIKRNEVKK